MRVAVFAGLLLGSGPALLAQAEYFPSPRTSMSPSTIAMSAETPGLGSAIVLGFPVAAASLPCRSAVASPGWSRLPASIPVRPASRVRHFPCCCLPQRFTYPVREHERFQQFVQALAGVARGFGGQFPTVGGSLVNSHTSFALLVGGGLDVRVGRRLSLRAVEADYGLTQLPNGVNDRQNLLRLSTGVTFRLR